MNNTTFGTILGVWIAALVFFVPSFAFAYAPASNCTFDVSGAGTAGIDGTYSYDGRSNSGTYEFSLNGGTSAGDPVLTYNANASGYYELRTYDYSLGYYYDSAAGGGSYPGINTTNSDGTNPTPTITEDCTGGGGGGNTGTTTPLTAGDSLVWITIWAGVFASILILMLRL